MFSIPKSSNSKIIITPNAIHITKYSTKYFYGHHRKKRKRAKAPRPADLHSPISSMFRARKAVKLIVESNSNPGDFHSESQFRAVFVTLTFGENITDIKGANQRFNLFIKRLNYNIRGIPSLAPPDDQRYIVVPEFQKSGRVHYHVIFFKFPKVKNTHEFVSNIWAQGFTFNSTIKNPDHLKNYITKYFVKSITDPRLKGKKHYFTSRNLLRPKVWKDEQENNQIIEFLQSTTTPDYQQTYGEDKEKVEYTLYKNSSIIQFLRTEKQIKKKPEIIQQLKYKKHKLINSPKKFVI